MVLLLNGGMTNIVILILLYSFFSEQCVIFEKPTGNFLTSFNELNSKHLLYNNFSKVTFITKDQNIV